ncbi:hypothetical protein GCM10009867_06310 [Pedococcus aerophilus]|uniref:DUF6504 domain-containing protein n=1 Tax=Pedococcus aerophilus TaxID=436356 RepID=A0ABP6GV28_9MICO
MVRQYEEPIEVRQQAVGAVGIAATPGGPVQGGATAGDPGQGGPAVPEPEAFVWRGRLYVVRAVLDRWQERRPWWREAREQGSGDVLAAARERQVWRVEASAGRCAAVGVYDLGADHQDLGLRWRLLRVAD